MSIPRLTSPVETLETQLVTSNVARLAFAVVAVGLALVLRVALRSVIGAEVPLLLLSLAVAAASAFGGLVPGLLATVIACIGSHALPSPEPGSSFSQVHLLACYGIVMSGLGWILIRSRDRVRSVDADNRLLEQKILEISEEERQRIGHDLHDGLGQHLTGISLLSESLNQQLAAGLPPRPEDVENVTRLVSAAVRWTRDLARNLSPLTIEHEGFIAAMEELTQNAGQLLHIQCEWDYSGGDLNIDPKRALHLYRIVQEAISNSVKHGKAKRVRVSLTVSGSQLTLQVLDDGSGLSRKTTTNPGLGLRIMEYRGRMVGARLSAERASPKGGTVVTCVTNIDASPAGSGS